MRWGTSRLGRPDAPVEDPALAAHYRVRCQAGHVKERDLPPMPCELLGTEEGCQRPS